MLASKVIEALAAHEYLQNRHVWSMYWNFSEGASLVQEWLHPTPLVIAALDLRDWTPPDVKLLFGHVLIAEEASDMFERPHAATLRSALDAWSQFRHLHVAVPPHVTSVADDVTPLMERAAGLTREVLHAYVLPLEDWPWHAGISPGQGATLNSRGSDPKEAFNALLNALKQVS